MCCQPLQPLVPTGNASHFFVMNPAYGRALGAIPLLLTTAIAASLPDLHSMRTVFGLWSNRYCPGGHCMRCQCNEPNVLPAHCTLSRLVSRRAVSILALGGSVTWGTGVDPSDCTYPFHFARMLKESGLVNETIVRNLAMRATGADVPSFCIQEDLRTRFSELPVVHDTRPPKSHCWNQTVPTRDFSFDPVDIVLLEYSINGLQGLGRLLRKVRQWFPMAIVIYIEVFSLQGAITSVRTQEEPAAKDPRNDWAWKKPMYYCSRSGLHCIPQNSTPHSCCPFPGTLGREVGAVGGFAISLRDSLPCCHSNPDSRDDFPIPVESFFQQFAPDWHHQSSTGHLMLAERIAGLVGRLALFNASPESQCADATNALLSSKVRDKCYNWLHYPCSGNLPPASPGLNITHLGNWRCVQFQSKTALQLEQDPTNTTVDALRPLRIVFLAKAGSEVALLHMVSASMYGPVYTDRYISCIIYHIISHNIQIYFI